ncbi:MAG: hypothetical protein AMXMBFR64_61450 [Myxococcales bacterium]
MNHPAPIYEPAELPRLPTAEELPCEDGVPMETSKHRQQMELLISTLSLLWSDRTDYYVGGNMFLYFSLLQTKRNDFRGPDFFVVLGTDNRPRKSWVMWEEELAPDVIVEITSPSTRAEDTTRKMHVYGQRLRVPFYFIFDPDSGEFEGYRLDQSRMEYTPIEPDNEGRLPCDRVDLDLGVWHGIHRNTPGPWLRWYTRDGNLVPSPEEALGQEAARAEQEAARAAQEAARAAQEAAARRAAEEKIADLEARLRALGGE